MDVYLPSPLGDTKWRWDVFGPAVTSRLFIEDSRSSREAQRLSESDSQLYSFTWYLLCEFPSVYYVMVLLFGMSP